MLDATNDIHSLADFLRHAGKFVKQLKKSKRPDVPTVEGKVVGAVLQEAHSYQRLMDIAARADASEGIRQGMDDLANSRHRAACEALEEFRTEKSIPR